jgi:hypothetical protein
VLDNHDDGDVRVFLWNGDAQNNEIRVSVWTLSIEVFCFGSFAPLNTDECDVCSVC